MSKELVVKHNSLINAKYGLGLSEQKVLLYAISKLDTSKEQFNIMEFDVQEFTNLIGKEGTKSKRYAEIRRILRDLRAKEIGMTDEHGNEFYAGWLTNIKMSAKTNKIRLKFDDDMIPYLLKLKSHFTRYELRNVIYLESKYSIRLYELLKQFEYKGKLTISVTEFRKLLLLEEIYPRFYDLEKRVVTPSIDEINNREETDLKVSHIVDRKGNKPVSISFTIESKDAKKQSHLLYINEFYNTDEMKVKMGLENEQFNNSQILEFYELTVEKTGGEIDIFKYIQMQYNYMKSKKSARNPYVYLLDCIGKDYCSAYTILKLENEPKSN